VSDTAESDADAATEFVCAEAPLPQDNATDEMTAKYNLRFLFFLSANFFINFNGLFFSNTLPRIFKDSRSAKRHEASRKDFVKRKQFQAKQSA
jgi:hypothetical protein